jgi:hypothetical protein
MAESLGSAVLTLGLTNDQFNAELDRSIQQARQAGQEIEKAMTRSRVIPPPPPLPRALQLPPPPPPLRLPAPQFAGGGENAFAALQSGLSALPGTLGQVGGEIAGIGAALGGLGAAAAAPAAIAAAVVAMGAAAVVGANDMQRMINQLNLMTGSAAATQAVIANLKQYAIDTPFEIPELIQTSSNLQSAGLNAAEAVEWTKRLGDIAVATGGQLGPLAVNLAQVLSKGGANIVDITQFAQRQIPIWDALQKVTGKSRAQLEALPGAIPASAITAALRSITDEGGRYFEAGKKGSTELDRQWTTLTDTIKQAALPLGQFLTPAIVGVLNKFVSMLQIAQAAMEGLGAIAQKISGLKIAKIFSDIFQGATGKGFLDAVKDVLGIGASKPPPIPKTGPSQDEKQKIADLEEQKQLALDVAVAKAKADKGTSAAQERLNAALAVRGLEGEALARAEGQLKIDKAQTDLIRAQLDYKLQLKSLGGDAGAPKAIEAKGAVDAAEIALRAAKEEAFNGVLSAQKKQYEEVAEAKKKAEGKVNEAQDKLNKLRMTVGLEGEALKIAEARGAIMEAMAKRDDAAVALDKALVTSNFNNNDPKVIEARGEFEAAGLNVKSAMIDGSNQAKLALAESAKKVKDAFDKFEKSQQGAFKLLSNRQQDELKRNAADKVIDLSNRRVIDLNNTLKELPGAFINLSGKLDVSRVEPDKLFGVTQTANGLVEAQTEVNKALAANTSALSENVKLLADKSWVVNVTAPSAATVSGDVLGGVP